MHSRLLVGAAVSRQMPHPRRPNQHQRNKEQARQQAQHSSGVAFRLRFDAFEHEVCVLFYAES